MDLLIIIGIAFAIIFLAFFLPIKGARSYGYVPPVKRFHEEDVVLSRRLLIQDSVAYESYYARHPERKDEDDRARQSPGLLNAGSKYFHPATFGVSEANFQLIEYLGALTHGQPLEKAESTKPSNPEKNTRFISEWTKRTGAHSIGFTSLKDYHLYSHKGRGPNAGKAIPVAYQNAIALTVEMDYEMMQAAPQGSALMESAEQYLQSGVLALKLAAFIREMGYEATAHIDGNYEVICPLVAVDAGLGVIGRMGLLMTPDLGPRVRIAVVSTNMPVVPSPAKPDRTTLHFCDLCKKCAANCPAAAIPNDSQKEIDGIPRWQINSEKCYQFWTVSGTDCGRCMTVCPYSHRDNWFHRFIRWGIRNNVLFRRLAVKMDDVFYGKKPSIRSLPDWMNMNS